MQTDCADYQTENWGGFCLLPGTGSCVISAPHCIDLWRNEKLKSAEPYTRLLAQTLHERTGCPIIYKTSDAYDDPNYNEHSPYKQMLVRYVQQQEITLVLDLHQMSALRKTAMEIGTGRGNNIKDTALVPALVDAFHGYGFEDDIAQDILFCACGERTVSATLARLTSCSALQIETNTRLLDTTFEENRFAQIVNGLSAFITAYNKAPKRPPHSPQQH